MTSEIPDYFSRLSYLVIETNSSCNLSCQTCNRQKLESEGLRTFKNLTVDEFWQMLQVFSSCPLQTIKLEGLSEPMLHPQFAELAQNLKQSFPAAQIIIATNGQYSLLKSPFLQTLPWVDMVYLSLDGIGLTFEKIRQGSSFKKMIQTLEDLANHTNVSERNKIYFNCTITEENYQEIPFFYELQHKYALGGVRLNLAQNWNENEKNQYPFSSELKSFLKKYKHDLKGVGGWRYSDCFWPFEAMVVDVFGQVRQCIINTSQKPIINIFDSNFIEEFNSGSHYYQIRKLLEKNKAAKNCENCDYHYLSPILEEIFGGKYLINRPRIRQEIIPSASHD